MFNDILNHHAFIVAAFFCLMIFLINFLNHEVFEHGHIVDSSIFQKKELIYEHILAVIRSLYGCHPIAISTYR